MDPMEEIKGLIEGQKKMLEDRLVPMEDKIKAFDDIEALELRVKAMEELQKKGLGVDLPGVNEGKDQFSFLKAFAGITTGNWDKSGFEKEVFDQTNKKALETGVGTAGGYIVPNQYIAEIIELLRAESVVMGLGATVLNGLVGSPVEIPKQTGGAQAYWVGENADITESEQTFGQINLTPKQVAALVKMSNRFVSLSDPSGEAMVRRDLAQVIALAIDLAALRGSGSANQPLGIANTPGIGNVDTVGAQGGLFDWDVAQAMEGTLEDANALRGSTGFAMHGAVKRKLKAIRIAQYSAQTDGEYIFNPVMSDQMLSEQIGHKVSTTTQIPTNLAKGGGAATLSEVYFANWQELLIGQWGGLAFMASQETSDAFAKNQTWVRVIQEVDIAVRHAESFVICNDAQTV